MTKKTNTSPLHHLTKIEPYWYAIIFMGVLLGANYIYHLAAGRTPDRVFLRLGGINLYWYGFLITTGIVLGAYVSARIIRERAVKSLNRCVPAELRQKPVTTLKLPVAVNQALTGRGIGTVGDLLLIWGFDPEHLELSAADAELVRQRLLKIRGVQEVWLTDAPWRQWNPLHVWRGVLAAFVCGIIGARLYHVLTPPPGMAEVGIESALDYFRDPIRILDIRRGGLGLYGGLLGAALGTMWYARSRRVSAWNLLDIGVVGLAVGQAFGRWGNFFNQEIYGRPTNLPWAITIDPAHRLPEYMGFERFHPAFLYESLWSLGTFLVLLRLARRHADRLKPGDLTAIYLICYAVGRTLTEMVRLNSRSATVAGGQIAVASLVSLGIIAAVAAVLIVRRTRSRTAAIQLSKRLLG